MALRKRDIAALSLDDRPFYRDRLDAGGLPAPWSLDDLEDFAQSSGDPYGGRILPEAAQVSLQVEATGEPPVWVGLGRDELARYAAGLARMWEAWGVRPGETIAFFDYGSSPLVLFASSTYLAYLRRGAADRLGLSTVCNDGVAAMSARMVTIVEDVAPSMVVVRRDLLTPFADALRTSGASLRERGVRWVAVTEPEGTAARSVLELFEEEWSLPLLRVLRADAACLLAGECRECGCFHLDRRLHRVEESDGEILFTNRFAKTCPTVRYRLGAGTVSRGECARSPKALRLSLD